jgi:hypothetical protein
MKRLSRKALTFLLMLVSVAAFGKTNAKSNPALYSHEFLRSASYAWALMASDGPVLKTDLNAAFVKLESKRHRTFDEDMLLLDMNFIRRALVEFPAVSPDKPRICAVERMLDGEGAMAARKYCGTWIGK